MKKEIQQLTPKEIKTISGAASGDITFSCCSWNLFGFELKVDLFSVSGNLRGATKFGYGFNRTSAYNRL